MLDEAGESPPLRMARFCTILGVSRGASGRRVLPPRSGSRVCVARQRGSVSWNVFVSIRHTSSSAVTSSSGILVLSRVDRRRCLVELVVWWLG
jgi:hypothetical protein